MLGDSYQTESIVASFREVAAQHDTTDNDTLPDPVN
jgi:hypothetical protein